MGTQDMQGANNLESGQALTEMIKRIFKGDKWNRLLGTRIPIGAVVIVVKFMPRRRVIISYHGELITTMLWCLKKVL